jgi:hypothetical protein
MPDAQIKITVALRTRLGKIAERMYLHGRRCHRVEPSGREIQPRQSVIIDAALDVASRHAAEFAQEVMRRTEERGDASYDFHIKAGGPAAARGR